jgi:hypothetical protein
MPWRLQPQGVTFTTAVTAPMLMLLLLMVEIWEIKPHNSSHYLCPPIGS